MREYSLKFFKHSRYDTSLVSNGRDDMSSFLTGITRDLVDGCPSVMIHDKMDPSMVMHACP